MKKLERIIFRVLGVLSLFISLNILSYVVEKKNISQAPGCLIASIVAMVLSLETVVEFIQTRNDVEEPIILQIMGGVFVALIDACALVYTISVIIKYSAVHGTFIAILAMTLFTVVGFILLWLPRFMKVYMNDNNDD